MSDFSNGDCNTYAEDVGPLGIDYIHLYSCTLKGFEPLTWLLLGLWICALMYLLGKDSHFISLHITSQSHHFTSYQSNPHSCLYLLGNTAEAYFSPTLGFICRRLKLPYSVAGVTFLAFGNGSPDVFSSISAFSGGGGSSDVSIGLSALLGGCMFVSTVVIGSVIIVAPGTLVDRDTFLRDVGSLLIGVTCLLFLSLIQKIHIVGPLLLLAVYGGYVWLVLATWKDPEDDKGSTFAAGTVKMQTAGWFPTHTDSAEAAHGSGTGGSLLSHPRPNPDTSDVEMQPFAWQGGGGAGAGAGAGAGVSGAYGYKFITLNEEQDAVPGGDIGRGEDQEGDDDDGSVTINFSGVCLSDGGGGGGAGDAGPCMLIQDDYFDTKLNNKLRNEMITNEKELKESLLSSEHTTRSDTLSQGVRGSTAPAGPTTTTRQPPATAATRQTPSSSRDPNSSKSSSNSSSSSRLPSLRNSQFPLGLGLSVPAMNRRAGKMREYWDEMLLRRRELHNVSMNFWMSSRLWEQMLIILQLPGVILRDMTIPTSDPELWSKNYAVAQPLSACVFILFVAGVPVWSPLWRGSMLGGVSLSAFVFLFSNTGQPPTQPIFALCWVLLGFGMCVVWIYTLAGELVSVLSSVGAIARIAPSLLGLTVLAWGNSIGDLFSNIAVAKQGLAELAVAGCYGGPVFNLLVGLGLSLLLACSQPSVAPNYTFYLPLQTTALVSFAFLYATLGLTILFVRLNDYRLPHTLGIFLISIYVVYSTVQMVLLL